MEEPLTREETLKRVLDELARRGYTEHFRAAAPLSRPALRELREPPSSALMTKKIPIQP